MMASTVAMAGNDNRRGTAGASQLLINPWTRSAGWGSVNIANARGLESFYANVAGLSFVGKTDIAYSNTMYGGGRNGFKSAAAINALGLAQRVSDRGVLAFSVMAVSFGDIDKTTFDRPEPTQGTFAPTFMNLNVAYSHSFTASIHGGVNIKLVNESTSDVSATGFGIDAGIQYVTGANDELKFGISLKNWGPTYSYSGTGLTFSFINPAGNNTVAEYPAAEMELPTCLNIGLSYDFLFDKWDQVLTLAGSFQSNAFLKDNYAVGFDYSLLKMVHLRAGYVYQRGLFSESDRTTFNTGFACGASFEMPLSKKSDATRLMLDYSFKTGSFSGTHSFGLSISL